MQLADQALALTVTRENKVQAEELLVLLNDAEKGVGKVFDPICDDTYRAWKTSTSTRASFLTPIENAKKHLKRGCSDVQRVLDQEAEAEARRASDELAAAERLRIQDEANQLADAGDMDAALEVLDQVETVVAPPLAVTRVEPARAAGITYRDNWTFQYVDAHGRPLEKGDVRLIPIEYHAIDESALRKVASALKDRTNIPGIRVFNDRQPVGVGGRR
jgi:hypothetical protein